MNNSDNTMTVKLQALTQGGSAIGPIIDGPTELVGKKAFIPYTIPNETVTAKITKSTNSFVEAELHSILEPSSDRVEPECKYFGKCGGCQLQHINLKAQRNYKLEMVSSSFRVKKIFPKEPAVLIGENLAGFNYRRRINLHLDSSGKIGFFKTGTGDLVEINKCLIAVEEINQVIEKLKKLQKFIANQFAGISIEKLDKHCVLIFKTGYNFSSDNLNEIINILAENNLTFKIIHNQDVLYSNLLEDIENSYEFGHFSQVNAEVNDLLIAKIKELIVGKAIDDLYAGGGNITFPIAKEAQFVRAVEADKHLVQVGKDNANLKNLTNIKFIASSVEKFIDKNELASTVVLDPPRSGAKYFANKVDKEITKEIIYVSCNLPSLIRDASILLSKGYELEKLYVLDMFPQTYHVEMLARFI
jgi:23S rRNA (uracil1939-C5)-methyltransferase